MIQNKRVESIRKADFFVSTSTTMEFSQKQDAFIRMMCVLLQPHEVEDMGSNLDRGGYDWHLSGNME